MTAAPEEPSPSPVRPSHRRLSARRRFLVLVVALVLVGLGIGLSGTITTGHGRSTGGGTVAPSSPHPTPTPTPTAAASPDPTALTAPWTGVVLIADRGNGRLIAVNNAGRIIWQFPRPGVPDGLAPGQRFTADDAFLAPDGRTIVANDENHQVVYRIDIATARVVWSYGHYDRAGSAPGYLHTPDDAYPLANGDVLVTDVVNCRILQVAPNGSVVRQFGTTGVCRDAPPASYGYPNGDTPLPDGGILITEIAGSRVVRLDAAGRVVFDIHVPLHYPSDAHLLPDGNVLVSDYSTPGALVIVSPTGRLVWRYAPTSGPGMLNHPSLAVPLANGDILLNDDYRDRVLLLDPSTGKIVWQYGHTGVASAAPGYLSDPDGLDPVPAGFHW